MKVIVFGASGMVGQGVLRECLLAPDVEAVLVVGRTATGVVHEKLTEVLHSNFLDFSSISEKLAGYDACFYALGISSAGLDEATYTRITHDYALAAGKAVLAASSEITFVFVSGASADDTEKSSVMWARVKGRTENALRNLSFRAYYCLRPGIIQPKNGAVSKTVSYRILYVAFWPVLFAARALFPGAVATTETIGRAMLTLARGGTATHNLPKTLGNGPIDTLAAAT